jgi:hypothetical protein
MEETNEVARASAVESPAWRRAVMTAIAITALVVAAVMIGQSASASEGSSPNRDGVQSSQADRRNGHDCPERDSNQQNQEVHKHLTEGIT